MADLRLPARGELIDGIASIDAADWDGCAGDADPFVRHDFIRLLESSGSICPATGFEPAHLVLRDMDGRVLAVAPMYRKHHSGGEFMGDADWARVCHQTGGRYYPKLAVGIPLIPVTGRRILLHPAAHPGTRAMMIDFIEQVGRHDRLSSAHAFYADEADGRAFADAGWLGSTDVQYHWTNRGYGGFDDFLATLTPKKRIAIRRERRAVAESGLRIHSLSGAAITAGHWNVFHDLYRDTYRRKGNEVLLTRDFFHRFGQDCAAQSLLILAERAGRWIAGVFCVIGKDRLYVRNWGNAEEHRFLHFEMCLYRVIDFAIERGMAIAEGGAGGQHKLARGFLPVMSRNAHWFADAALRDAAAIRVQRDNRIVGHVFEQERARTPYRDIHPDSPGPP